MTGPNRRQDIMQAAESLFRNRRFHEITLDQVAQTARVGKGTIYRYFNDKDDLFFETATSGFDELCALLRREVPGNAPFTRRLSSTCEQVTDFFRVHGPLIRMMDAEHGRLGEGRASLLRRWLTRRRKLIVALASMLDQGVAAGRIRSDVPAEILATYLLGMLRTRSRDLQGEPIRYRRLDLALDLFLRGSVRPGGSDPPPRPIANHGRRTRTRD
jgi:AcrR family transcriptional regulator